MQLLPTENSKVAKCQASVPFACRESATNSSLRGNKLLLFALWCSSQLQKRLELWKTRAKDFLYHDTM